MKELLLHPGFWGAAMALIGVLSGALLSGWNNKKRYDLDKMGVNIAFLQAEHERVVGKLKVLEETVDRFERNERLMMEKYSVALADDATVRIAVASAKARLAAQNVWTADLPPVPKLIEPDMLHQWPDAIQ